MNKILVEVKLLKYSNATGKEFFYKYYNELKKKILI